MGLIRDMSKLEPYRDAFVEAQVMQWMPKECASFRACGFEDFTLTVAQRADGYAEVCMEGRRSLKNRKRVFDLTGFDVLRESDFVRTEDSGDLWVFDPPTVH